MPSMLGNGTSALLAFQRALNTVSHNIANSSTAGYTRQRVELANRAGSPDGVGYTGAGVTVAGITRLSDSLVTGRLLDSGGELGRLQLGATLAGRVDRLFSDVSTNLTGPWSNFFDAAEGVAAQPGSTAAREDMLARANALTARFDLLDAGLQQVDDEIDAKLVGGAEEVNRLTTAIAKLNTEVARSARDASPDLLDERDRLIGELSTLVGVTTLPQEDGSLNVFTSGGQPLVVGASASRFTAQQDDYRPDRSVLVLQTPTGTVRLGPGTLGGSLGGAIALRAEMVDPTRAELGRVATGLALSVNAQSARGMDLNGNQGTDFFTLPAPVAAPNRLNTGAGTLAIGVTDLGNLTGAPFVLRFDGAGWVATDAVSGAPVAMTGTGTPADPLVIGGLSIVPGGTPATNDRFLVDPTGQASRGIAVAINDPNRIAAASLVRPSADLGNIGDARVVSLTVNDAGNPALTTPSNVVFLDATTYSIDGGPPQPFVPGGAISANGWTLVLDGLPAAGDTFSIGANQAGSSDNTNMRAWSALEAQRLLGNGNTSLNDAIGGLTTRIGSTARDAAVSLQGQEAIDAGLVAEREGLSGVNLDEEASNLLRYQQAYQAAAQVIATSDTLFQAVLAAARR
jgi:flagellar hook-associated protein 1 FlgK